MASVDSAPLSQIVEHTLLVSDNEAAEVLAHHVGLATGGSGSFEDGARGVQAVLGELGVRGDIALLAIALMAPIESSILEQQVNIEQIDLNRIRTGWADLARRIVENPVDEGAR